MQSIYQNEIIGSPVYEGLSLGGILYYTTPGADTFDKGDYPGLRAVIVECQGGGGGSGGAAATTGSQNAAGGGGHGGGYARSLILATDLDESEAVTVGARGAAAGAGGFNGGAGGDSIFDTISGEVRGVGGSGGVHVPLLAFPALATPGGTAGAGGTGDVIHYGGSPTTIIAVALNNLIRSCGGGSYFSSGVVNRTAAVVSANAEQSNWPGVGATGPQNGSSQSARAGAAGGPGIVIVTLLY